MTAAHALAIFAAAFLAGLVNAVAGGGTLLTFPTLVWIGRDPIIANATNAVALWPGSLASMIGFRRELRGDPRLLRLLIGPSIAGGALGAVLLLRTPSRTFEAIVPYLILFATVLFAAQAPITRALHRRRGVAKHTPDASHGLGRGWWIAVVAFQFLVAVYGGYFGAGMGILMLAALGLLGQTDIHRMNGLKNAFALCINGVAAVYFTVSGAVDWTDAVVMAGGAIIGGYGGAGIARRLGHAFVRRAIVVIGVAVALSFFLRRH